MKSKQGRIKYFIKKLVGSRDTSLTLLPPFPICPYIQFCAKSEDNFQNVPLISYKTTLFKKKYFEDISYRILIKCSPPNREFETVHLFIWMILFILCCSRISYANTKKKNNVTILLTYIVKSDIKISFKSFILKK